MIVVELVGLTAAAVAAAAAIRGIRGSSERHGLPVALIALKLPTGAITAFLGLLLMRGQFVPGLSALDTSAQILAWALGVRVRATAVHAPGRSAGSDGPRQRARRRQGATRAHSTLRADQMVNGFWRRNFGFGSPMKKKFGVWSGGIFSTIARWNPR